MCSVVSWLNATCTMEAWVSVQHVLLNLGIITCCTVICVQYICTHTHLYYCTHYSLEFRMHKSYFSQVIKLLPWAQIIKLLSREYCLANFFTNQNMSVEQS